MQKFMSFISRLFFVVALVFIAVAIVDWCMRLFGWTISFVPYQPGRLFEFAAMLMVVVAVMLLRQIRDNTRP